MGWRQRVVLRSALSGQKALHIGKSLWLEEGISHAPLPRAQRAKRWQDKYIRLVTLNWDVAEI